MRHVKIMAAVLATAGAVSLAFADSTPRWVPKDGFVPNAATAIQIAVAVWTPIYGASVIASEKPYRAVLKDGVWTVTGSLKDGWAGGVALAKIAKKDGQVLQVIHGE